MKAQDLHSTFPFHGLT